MEELTKAKIALGFCVVIMVITFILLALQVNNGIDNYVYKPVEGTDFCSTHNMSYEVYMNGDKFCSDNESLYPIRITGDTFKFVIRGKHE